MAKSHCSFPTPFPRCPEWAQHPNTNTLAELATTYTLRSTCDCPSHTRDGCMWLTSTVVEDHAMTLTSTPSNYQTPLFLPSSNPPLNTLWLEAIARYSPPLFRDCMAGTLSVNSLEEAHKFYCE